MVKITCFPIGAHGSPSEVIARDVKIASSTAEIGNEPLKYSFLFSRSFGKPMINVVIKVAAATINAPLTRKHCFLVKCVL